LPDGSLAFDERELDHMRDVKEVYNYLTLVAVLALAVGISAGVVLYRRGGAAAVWGTLSDGGLITLLGLGALGVLMLTSWDAFFTGFHALFFESGTWRFSYSDTLIRLFPQQFWQDAGILVVIVVALLAFVLALVGRVMQRRLVRHERTPEVPSIPSQPQGE
jgi:integral membrane protein (TIGR01906 family)